MHLFLQKFELWCLELNQTDFLLIKSIGFDIADAVSECSALVFWRPAPTKRGIFGGNIFSMP